MTLELLSWAMGFLGLGVLVLALALWALARQIGVLHERIAPIGALMIDAGPAVGDRSPLDWADSLDGPRVRIGAPSPGATLILFVSPTCPVCKKLIPIAKRLDARERDLEVVFASDGLPDEHRTFARQVIGPYPYVLSAELGLAFKVSKLPHAVLIDPAGVVRAKGLVNSREQLESLLTARELAVRSIQDFMRREQPTHQERT